MRDMIGALVVLLAIIGVLVFATRSCSFSPGGPEVDPNSAPTVDVGEKLRGAAASAGFPIRQPAVPTSWHPNSSGSGPVGSGAAASIVVRVGWITQDGRYVQLSQSGGTEREVVVAETGAADPAPTGTVEAGGHDWTTYPARRDETAWVTELDGVTLLITGNAGEAEFRTLAAAVTSAKPLAP
jgi:uncharacterized protein DUF4245